MAEEAGVVYLVGAGPGDPGLITVRGRDCLARADVVLYDALVNPALLALAPQAKHLYVGKRPDRHSLSQDELNALLVEQARMHRCVVRLKGGDPFVFGRGGEEAEILAQEGIPFEVVPGITAGIAATAYAGIPVTHRDLTSSVSIITGHRKPQEQGEVADLSRLGAEGTLVFYMGVKNLPRVVAELRRIGRSLDTPAAAIEWGTMPWQWTVVSTLENLEARCKEVGLGSPAVIIVGEVIELRETLNWFESRPLYGLRIAVTRSQARASEMVQELCALGADVFEFPTIAIQPVDDSPPQEPFNSYDWIVLTSVHSAEALFRRLDVLRLDARALAGVRLCVIGSATAELLGERFLDPDLIPAKYDAAHTLTALLESEGDLAGKRFLLPRSDIAPGFLPDELRKRGAEVTEWIAYRTVMPEVPEELRDSLIRFQPEWVTFTSGSTVRNFCALLGKERLAQVAQTAKFAAIGPVTAKIAEEHFLTVSAQPDQYDVPSLIEAIRQAEKARIVD